MSLLLRPLDLPLPHQQSTEQLLLLPKVQAPDLPQGLTAAYITATQPGALEA